MKIKIAFQLVLILSLFYQCNGPKDNKSNDEIENTNVQSLLNSNVVTLDPIDAMNNPSKHAWDLFMYLNHPAKDYKKGRGLIDSTKKIGDPGMALWETWKHAGTEVFLEDGSLPPSWDDYKLDPYLNKSGKRLEGSTAALIAVIAQHNNKVKEGIHTFIKSDMANFHQKSVNFNPEDGAIGGGGETRMNKSTFDFIIKNELYNLQGVQKFRGNYLKLPVDKRKGLSFDKESIEAKAMWKKFTDEELKNNAQSKYYIAVDDSGTYGLVSLHIITKEIPNWFWCSFRHKDGPIPKIPSVDDYGQPQALNGTIWSNYELSGTQTSFTDAKGKAILLSDPHVEEGFETSSCISCHALAVTGPGFDLDEDGSLLFLDPRVRGSRKPGEVFGAPNEKWFLNSDGSENLVQTDFVYSIPFRVHKKK